MRMIEYPDGTSEPFPYAGDVLPGITALGVGDEPEDSFEAILERMLEEWQERTPGWERFYVED